MHIPAASIRQSISQPPAQMRLLSPTDWRCGLGWMGVWLAVSKRMRLFGSSNNSSSSQTLRRTLLTPTSSQVGRAKQGCVRAGDFDEEERWGR